MKTFEEMAAEYIEWTRKDKLRGAPNSKTFWERQERILNEQVVPFTGGLTSEEQYRKVIECLRASIEAGTRNEGNRREREEAMDAFMAVYSHYLDNRSRALRS